MVRRDDRERRSRRSLERAFVVDAFVGGAVSVLRAVLPNCEFGTRAGSTTSIASERAGTGIRRIVILVAFVAIHALTQVAHAVAGLTRCCARRIATIAVDAETTQTLAAVGVRARSPILLFAYAHAVTGYVRPRARRHGIAVVRASIDIVTYTLHREIAGFARRLACAFAAVAIGAEAARAICGGGTRLTIVFFAVAVSVARIRAPTCWGGIRIFLRRGDI